MKKYSIILLLILLPILARAQILITEIMYNLPGADDGREWIEIYNNGPVYDISNWKFEEGGVAHGINYVQGGVIADGQLFSEEYAIIADDSSQFLIDNPNFQGKLYDSSFSLSNTGESLKIRDASDVNSDTVTYSSSQGADGDGNSLRLTGSNWQPSTPTPGGELVVATEPLVEMVDVSGLIDVDTTWAANSGVYVLNGEVTVASSTTLTIEPGVVIKSKNGGSGALKVFGNLNVAGTIDEKVVFTSILDDSVGGHTNETDVTAIPGDWGGIIFESGSSGSLDYVEIYYAGYQGQSIKINGGEINVNNSKISKGKLVGVVVNDGDFNISNTEINNNTDGLEVWGGRVTATKNSFSNNTIYGIYARGDNTSLDLQGNNFSSNNKTAFVEASVDFTHENNLSLDLLIKGFEVSGYVKDGSVWHSRDLPIINIGGITIKPSVVLILDAGTMIKMNQDAYLQVEGTLVANGEEPNPIFFTSAKDEPVTGDWAFLLFSDSSVGDLNYVNFGYAGAFIYPYIRSGIVNLGGSLTINNSNFSSNHGSDIYQEGGSLKITNSTFSSNRGILVKEGSASVLKSKFAQYMTGVENSSASSTVVATGNWWGVKEGPRVSDGELGSGAYALGLVEVDPWIKRDPALPNPVIIVPGMVGSRLNDISEEKWPNIITMTLSDSDSYLDDLILDENGFYSGNIFASSLIKEIGGKDFFNGLFTFLSSMGYEESVDLFEYPYDWRLDLSNSAASLIGTINEVKLTTGAEKVDIVAHSMGGLLVKKYLKDNGGNSIGKFVDIATPQRGSPKAFKILSYGDDMGASFLFGLLGLNQLEIKSISQNMPAVYQLLPSRNYFDESNSNYKYYVFDGINGNRRLSFDQTKEYLKSQGRNSLLVDRADEFHQEIDGLDPEEYGVSAYNIVGCGTPTIGQFYVLSKNGDHYNYNIRFINGDGTVPLKSAEALPARETYFVKSAQHAVLPSTSGVKELIASILTDDSFNTSDYSNIVASESECPVPDGKIVSFHSPINLNVYDSSGNHAGPNENGDIENNIPRVEYEVIEDNKFAFLPTGQTYQITGESTGVGVFDLRIEDMVNGEVVQTSMFTDVPLTETTQINFDLGASVPGQIYLDSDGDNNFESTFDISTTTIGFVESDGDTKKEAEVIISNTVTSTDAANSSSGVLSLASSKIILPQKETYPLIGLIESKDLETKSSVVTLLPEETNNHPQEGDVVIKEKGLDNTAIVFKSFGQKFIDFIKSIWYWFISKL